MNFEYYYLIQDILGVLIAFIGLRMSLLSCKIISIKGISINTLLLFSRHFLFAIAGINLLVSSFGITSWIFSFCILIVSIIIAPNVRFIR